MSILATAMITAAFAASSVASAPADASLRFVSAVPALAGVSFGLDAIDGRPLFLAQRTLTQLRAGKRTIWYSCPTGSSRAAAPITFDFVPGERYQLTCGNSGIAQIRADENC